MRQVLTLGLLALLPSQQGCIPDLDRTTAGPGGDSAAPDSSLRFPDAGIKKPSLSLDDGGPSSSPDSSAGQLDSSAVVWQPDTGSGQRDLPVADSTVPDPDVGQPDPDIDPPDPDIDPPEPDMEAPDPDLDPPDPDLDPPDPDSGTGKWYQANFTNCPTFCSAMGLTNVAGPEGAHCMSGEVRSGSGIAQGITFTYGCWPSCAPFGPHQATSYGSYCYMPGQKKDNDVTDRTVGCFCAP